MTLADLQYNARGRITGFTRESDSHGRLLRMGVVPGAEATVLRKAPLGDPMQVRVEGTLLSIRLCDALHIQVEHA